MQYRPNFQEHQQEQPAVGRVRRLKKKIPQVTAETLTKIYQEQERRLLQQDT